MELINPVSPLEHASNRKHKLVSNKDDGTVKETVHRLQGVECSPCSH